MLNPGLCHFQRLTILASRRKPFAQATNSLFIRPARGSRVIQTQSHLQMIVEHRVRTHFNVKNRRQFLQQTSLPPSRTSSSLSLGVTQLLPLLPMLTPLTTKKRPPHTPGNAVVIRSHRRIHQLTASHRHFKNSAKLHANPSRMQLYQSNSGLTMPVLLFCPFVLNNFCPGVRASLRIEGLSLGQRRL